MLLLFAILPALIHAASYPTLGSDLKQFNMQSCTQESARDCIRSACIVDSPSNCRTQCQTYAVNKCRSIAGQQLLLMK